MMNTNNKTIQNLAIFSVLILAGCGTFEIGIENNVVPETVVETEESPVSTAPILTEEPTANPPLSDEAAISAALAGKLGISIEEGQFAITEISSTHAKGNVSNGYFLAAKQDGTWLIVYDGQANPPCRDIELNKFPSAMVPECLDENDQLIVRSSGEEIRIGEALSEYFGVPLAELDYTVIQDTGTHALGYIPDGYFLAAKAGERWLIAYDGNGTPYCAQVDLHNFPGDMVPECMDASNNLVYRTDNANDPTSSLESLDCGPGSLGANPGSVESIACNIQDGLRSRNISALLGSMSDPFIIGYWLSEGVWYSPQEFLNYLPQLYNFNDPDYTPRLTFTTDRDQFPDLDGRPLEGVFGPDVNVVEVIYSQGWGVEGDQEALIYLSQDSAGQIKWHGMLYGKFDFPP
jgi:hypothetical protein